jgi:uncharacterized repeat protein (TIGR01451 family)
MLIGAGAALAAATGIELRTVAETDVTVVDAEGKERTERVAAATVIPGDEVIYTVYYSNRSEEAADDVVITNPVPNHMIVREIDDGMRGALVTVSIDGGRHYDVPQNLTVTDAAGNVRRAEASDYTHVRWTLHEPLAPGDEGSVSFRAQLQ